MKFQKIFTITVAVLAFLVGSTSAATANSHSHSHSAKVSIGKKAPTTSQEAIAAYQAAQAAAVSADEAAKAKPAKKALKRAAKKADLKAKKAFRAAKGVIAHNFHKAVNDAKKTYRAAVKGKKNQPDVISAAQAARALAIANATSTRDTDSALLESLKPKK